MANSKSKADVGSKYTKVSYKPNSPKSIHGPVKGLSSSKAYRSAPYTTSMVSGSILSSGIPSKLTPLHLIDRSREGLDSSEADRVASLLGVTDKEMARLLNQSVSTFHRRAKSERLDAATSERLLMLGRLANHGAAVFQDSGKFIRWLRRPLRLLADREPLDLMDGPTGVLLIEDILGRIEHGVFS